MPNLKLLEHTITTFSPRNNTNEMRTETDNFNMTVFNRKNRKVPVFSHFDPSVYQKAFNVERTTGVTVKDAIIDPYQTLSSPEDLLGKNPIIKELNKRGSIAESMH